MSRFPIRTMQTSFQIPSNAAFSSPAKLSPTKSNIVVHTCFKIPKSHLEGLPVCYSVLVGCNLLWNLRFAHFTNFQNACALAFDVCQLTSCSLEALDTTFPEASVIRPRLCHAIEQFKENFSEESVVALRMGKLCALRIWEVAKLRWVGRNFEGERLPAPIWQGLSYYSLKSMWRFPES